MEMGFLIACGPIYNKSGPKKKCYEVLAVIASETKQTSDNYETTNGLPDGEPTQRRPVA